MDKAKSSISILMLYCILLFSVAPENRSFARSIAGSTPNTDQTTIITFLIRNVLNGSTTSSRPSTAAVTRQLPFSKPLGLFPPEGGIPIPLSEPDPTTPSTGRCPNTLGASLDGSSFPIIATRQELELGTVTPIDEELFEVSVPSPSRLIGKGQGIYVASSTDGTSHMMAMAASFAGSGFRDGLRFFGVHRRDVPESHIAVIGGTGKYDNANGYASVKAVDGSMNLLFTVYLS